MLKSTLAVLLLLCSASTSFAAKLFDGQYTVTFFSDPGHKAGSQICLTLTPSSPIAGFPESGTFVDDDGNGISGQFVVDGTIVHLIMLVTGFGDNVDMIGPQKAAGVLGNFDDFESGYNGGANTDISSGTFKLVPHCANVAGRRHPSHNSVTR